MLSKAPLNADYMALVHELESTSVPVLARANHRPNFISTALVDEAESDWAKGKVTK